MWTISRRRSINCVGVNFIFHFSFDIFYSPFWLPLPLGEGWGEGLARTKLLFLFFFCYASHPHPWPLSQRERGTNRNDLLSHQCPSRFSSCQQSASAFPAWSRSSKSVSKFIQARSSR